MSFAAHLAADAERIDARLAQALTGLPEGALRDAMRHALRGGKRLRGHLVLEGVRLHGIDEAIALPAAAAVEAMHAYSLVHDDLPAMDDDDLRRGLPTVHRLWGEAVAILAGDALQSLAFGMLADPALGPASAELVAALARAAGARGMVHGQALDIAAESAPAPLTLEQITELQAAKTGALIGFAATAGAMIAGADPAPLATYARALGLAFQIADDILDVTGDAAATGKRVGKDRAAGKATFVSLLGLDGARMRAAALVTEARAALAPYGARAENLIAAAEFSISREA